MINWHLISIEQSLTELSAHQVDGLSQSEAQSRLAQYGRNELVEKGGRTPLKIFWEQITATMVLILVAAAVVAGLLGDTKNTMPLARSSCSTPFLDLFRNIVPSRPSPR